MPYLYSQDHRSAAVSVFVVECVVEFAAEPARHRRQHVDVAVTADGVKQVVAHLVPVLKTFFFIFTDAAAKLECSSMINLYSLV
jgi:hypothetical protein